MKEYIEKAALKKRFQKRLIWLEKDAHDEYSKGLFHGCETDMGLIDEIPVADVVKVLRCKDCQFWQNNNGGYPHPECRWGNDETPDADDYCSFGELKNG